MSKLINIFKYPHSTSIDQDQALDKMLGVIAHKVWPWRDRWLSVLVAIIVLLDFGSTYLLLKSSNSEYVYEAGVLARWVLSIGNMWWLLLADLLAIAILISLASTLRSIYLRRGNAGYSRALFIVLQIPLVLVTAGAIINNVILTHLI